MLYYILYPLRQFWFGFNIFKYITFRAALASVTAFLISIIFGPIIINMLRRLNVGQHIRKEHVEELYALHKHKSGTPTMGGLIILLSIITSTVLWGRLDNRYTLLCLISLAWLGIVGFIDDYIKLVMKRSLGLSASAKFAGQAIIAVLIALYLYHDKTIDPTIYFPFFKNVILNLGVFYVLFVIVVMVGTSNAVNLTDGLDGLAIGCVTIAAMTYSVISYITGHVELSGYLNVYHLPGSGELSVICAAMFGAGLGFLWFNSHPASVFMGDTGALPLGGVIGLISILIKSEIILFLVGGVFVAEVLSVILQVLSVKLRGRRIFLMSPLHHHFQLKGMHESKVIIRFWIVAVILALMSLGTLKMR